MNCKPLIFAALFASLIMAGTYAAAAEKKGEGIIEEKIRTLAPNATTIAISETPIDGILQVQINSDIVYVTADARYLLQGQIMDIDTRTNLTDQAKSGIRVGLLTEL